MGRHSVAADEDEDDLLGSAAVQVVEAPDRRGRHASSDDDGEPTPVAPAATAPSRPHPTAGPAPAPAAPVEAATSPIPRVDPEAATWSTVPIPPVEGAPAEPSSEPGPTARDFALFRSHPDVRNRAIAGVLAPFVVYAVVMVVIARTDVFLIWLWIPLILAGVLMGLILDLGHKRYAARGDDRTTSGSADRP